jgi:hypothetical protein
MKYPSTFFKIEKINPNYTKGLTNYHGKKIDITKVRIRNKLKNRLLNHSLPIVLEERETIIKMYLEGKTIKELEFFFQRSEVSIFNILDTYSFCKKVKSKVKIFGYDNYSTNKVEKYRTKSYNKEYLGYIYVLLLKKNKLYVGYSQNIKQRIKTHFNSKNSTEWLKLYPPIENIIKVKTNKEFESLLVKYLMIEFGVNNVRGGPYTRTIDYKIQPTNLDNFKLSE